MCCQNAGSKQSNNFTDHAFQIGWKCKEIWNCKPWICWQCTEIFKNLAANIEDLVILWVIPVPMNSWQQYPGLRGWFDGCCREWCHNGELGTCPQVLFFSTSRRECLPYFFFKGSILGKARTHACYICNSLLIHAIYLITLCYFFHCTLPTEIGR